MTTPATKARAEVANGRAHRKLGLASAQVYAELRQRILDGRISPGTRLRHRTLAAEMGTSNGPVMGALRRLAHDGLISYQPTQGGMVKEFTDEDLADAMILRRALETEAARLAARRASPEDIERLYEIVRRMGDIVRREAWDQADDADVELHVAIGRLTRSTSLMDALERCHLRDLVRRRLLAHSRRRDFQNLQKNHRVLVDAIASHNPELAGQAMHRHLSPKTSASDPARRAGRARR